MKVLVANGSDVRYPDEFKELSTLLDHAVCQLHGTKAIGCKGDKAKLKEHHSEHADTFKFVLDPTLVRQVLDAPDGADVDVALSRLCINETGKAMFQTLQLRSLFAKFAANGQKQCDLCLQKPHISVAEFES